MSGAPGARTAPRPTRGRPPALEVDLTFRTRACTLFSVSIVNFTTATTTTTRFGGRGAVRVAW
jgi:hypothetical protein